MTKARKPRPDRNEKAPEASVRTAPSQRGGEKRRPKETVVAHEKPGRDSQRIPYPENKSTSRNAVSHEHEFGARVSRRAADRLRAGHVWVYASDVESLNAGGGDAPALLPVADSRGLLLGTALYSPTSQIALRMVSRESIGEAEWLDLLGRRLKNAISRRVPVLNSEKIDCDSFRLCFSEADEIPGLIVDKYGELVIVQLLAKGLDSAAVRQRIVATIREFIKPAAILERPDPRIRELEGLSAPSLEPLYAADPKNPLTATRIPVERADVSLRRRTLGRRPGPSSIRVRTTRRLRIGHVSWRRTGGRWMCALIRVGLRCTWRGLQNA